MPRLAPPPFLLLGALVVLAGCAEAKRGEAAEGPPAGDVRSEVVHPVVGRLHEALAGYRRLAEAGGWPEVPEGEVVRPGERSPGVPALRRRLYLTGDLDRRAGTRRDSVYDRELAGAVARFQLRHGIDVDSLVGAGTREAMNVPAAERVRQIEEAIARFEALPDSMGRRYVVVNLPEFRLRAYEDGRQALKMNVVVGDEVDGRGTPSFRDTMEHVIFRPYWNVPQGIAAEEIVPDARRDPGYLAREGFEIAVAYGPDAEALPATPANLARVEAGELRVRQRPGDGNALGMVKFMFPNEHAIYLHDTPARHLFTRTQRAASHGCIRVARPADLAEWVLRGKEGWDRARIERALAGGEEDADNRQVNLDDPIPIYIVYWPVYADDDGTVYFVPDVYGRFET